MVCVVGVRFKKAGKVYYFDPAEHTVPVGAKVVVETARGVEYGEIAVGPKDVAEDQVVQPLKKVLRIGNEKDAMTALENTRKEKEAFSIAQKKIAGHGLEMNLVDVEYTFDGSKIIFYFTAEGRIDFRELVRDLASVFRTRIEMRQIGVRDEAKLLGGIGPCGRVLCCTSFLGDFAPVSIRMAKDQNLSLNPSKISGLCGRLMCCLRYEQETYEEAKKDPTLAPGYVPPAATQEEEEEPAWLELEDRPARPVREARGGNESGVGARIAQAAGMSERPKRRDERDGDRKGATGRPQVRSAQNSPQPSGEAPARKEREGRGQSGQVRRPDRPRPQAGQGPGAERPQGRPARNTAEQAAGPIRAPRPEADRPLNEGAIDEEGKPRSRRPRNRRRRGGSSSNPQS